MAKRSFGTIDKLPSGRFRARFIGPDGVTYSAKTAAGRALTFTTRGDADVYLGKQLAAISAETWKPPGQVVEAPVTLDAYATKWLARRTLSPTTRQSYLSLLEHHIEPTFGGVAVAAITKDAVEDWHARDAKPTAKAHAYSLLRTILATAVDDDLIAKNPCRVRGGGSTPTVKQLETVPPPEKIAELVAVLNARYQALAVLAVWTSCRQGELFALERTDLDLDAGILHIRKGVVVAEGRQIVKAPKTKAGLRTVTLPSHVVPILRAHLEAHSGPKLVFPAATDPTKHMSGSTLWKVFKPALQKVDLEGLTWHQLRGVGQSYAAANGATLVELMQRAGQVSPAAAMRYLVATNPRQKEIADRLADYATGKTPDAR